MAPERREGGHGDGGQIFPNFLGLCGLCASRLGRKVKQRKGKPAGSLKGKSTLQSNSWN